MTLIDQEGKITELQAGDSLSFHVHSKTISFHRGSKLFFRNKIEEDNSGKLRDKISIEFISSKEDFSSFATFIGKIFLLEGEFKKSNGDNYSWLFTHKGVGEETNLKPGAVIRIDQELTAIMFQIPDSKYRPIKNVSFIKNLDDYKQLFYLLSRMIDESGTIKINTGSRKIIFE